MIVERTHVGLDVHAHAMAAAAIDRETGELMRRRMTADPLETLARLRTQPGPAAAAHEAGPTGFTLARSVRAAGMPLTTSPNTREGGDSYGVTALSCPHDKNEPHANGKRKRPRSGVNDSLKQG